MQTILKSDNITFGKDVFIADGVKLIGEITIGDNSSIWFNTVLRADMNKIEIGKNTNVQDLSVLHVTNDNPLKIGDNVTVGHNAILHACTVEDNALIGMGSIVLDGAVIGNGALVAAGCVVPPNKVVPAKTLVVGNPMKIARQLSDADLKAIEENKDEYVRLSTGYLNMEKEI